MKCRYFIQIILVSILLAVTACQNEDTTLLKNDFIKKTIGPNIVNDTIEFAYAMAIPGGKIVSAEVVASIAGAPNTRLEPYSWYTNKGGVDIPVIVAKDCITENNKSVATFIDTCASTLRYKYAIPEEARGKTVSFRFSCTANNGETATISSPEYKVSKMYKQRSIMLTSGAACYLSLKQMKAFTLAEVIANNLTNEIDLIYFYNAAVGVTHSLVSPATSADYLYGTIIPTGSTNDNKISKRRDVRDLQLGSPKAEFIDDLDFETLNIDAAQNFVYNLNMSYGAFIITGNGKYKAFILVNYVDDTSKKMLVSIKRYDVN